MTAQGMEFVWIECANARQTMVVTTARSMRPVQTCVLIRVFAEMASALVLQATVAMTAPNLFTPTQQVEELVVLTEQHKDDAQICVQATEFASKENVCASRTLLEMTAHTHCLVPRQTMSLALGMEFATRAHATVHLALAALLATNTRLQLPRTARPSMSALAKESVLIASATASPTGLVNSVLWMFAAPRTAAAMVFASTDGVNVPQGSQELIARALCHLLEF